MAKARVAPLKPQTLPHLELTALELGARVASYLVERLGDFRSIYLWTDNEISLFWVGNKESGLPYVRNRVQKITELSKSNWKLHHCPTKENPADLLSRGTTIKKLRKTKLWEEGPAWLLNGEWPVQKQFGAINLESCSLPVALQPEASPINNIQSVIDEHRYSDLSKLLNITGYVF